MVASHLEIVNLALSHLGEQSLSDPTFAGAGEPARMARVSYRIHRDAVLAEHPWNFATTRLTLSAAGSDPIWGPSNAYVLSSNVLRVLSIENDLDYDWEVEYVAALSAVCLVTNVESPVSLRVIWRIDDPTLYRPHFVTALAAHLALHWAEPLGKATTLIEKMARIYNAAIRLARTVDSQEGSTKQVYATEWLDARGRGAIPDVETTADPY